MRVGYPDLRVAPQVLHVVVGHNLPIYFMNAIKSVRAVAPEDPVLIVDNASPNARLRRDLSQLSEKDELIHLILRSENDVHTNQKVGSLYAAYQVAFDWAIAHGFDLLHLIQGDIQMLWWDLEFIRRSNEIFDAHPLCVNIHTLFLPRDTRLSDALILSNADGLNVLRKYGLTDTGLYHLGRWKEGRLHFGASEQEHASRHLNAGLEVIWHPWPTDAQIPWPAVIRNGARQGKEVVSDKPYLLKPMASGDIRSLKEKGGETWLEDVCVPWGWVCATPMWTTDLNSMNYWVMRYREAKVHGISRIVPRIERSGVGPEDRRVAVVGYRYRPSLFRLFVSAPMHDAVRRLATLCSRLRRPGQQRRY
jgi:hypothetical protein